MEVIYYYKDLLGRQGMATPTIATLLNLTHGRHGGMHHLFAVWNTTSCLCMCYCALQPVMVYCILPCLSRT